MRHFRIPLTILLVLLFTAFNAEAQTPSPNPQVALPPAPLPQTPDPQWSRIQQLRIGQDILVYTTEAAPLRCRFTGATDAYLFCNPADSPTSAGYRLDRATVISVDIAHPVHNWHPAWLASVIAGGLIVGITATANNNAGDSARDGFIAAVVVGAVGAPLALLNQRDPDTGVVFRPLNFAHHSPGSGPHFHFLPFR